MLAEKWLKEVPPGLETHNVSITPPTNLTRLLGLTAAGAEEALLSYQPLQFVRIPEMDGGIRYIGVVQCVLTATELYTLQLNLAPHPNPNDKSLQGVLGDFSYMLGRGRNSELALRHAKSLQPAWDELLNLYLPTLIDVLSYSENTLFQSTQSMLQAFHEFREFLQYNISDDPFQIVNPHSYSYHSFKQGFLEMLQGQFKIQPVFYKGRFGADILPDDEMETTNKVKAASLFTSLREPRRVELIQQFLFPNETTLADQFVTLSAYAINRTPYLMTHAKTSPDPGQIEAELLLRVTGPDTVIATIGRGVELDIKVMQGEGIFAIDAEDVSPVRSTNFVVPVLHWRKQRGERHWLHYLHSETPSSPTSIIGRAILNGIQETYGSIVRPEALNPLVGRLFAAQYSTKSGPDWADKVGLSVDRQDAKRATAPREQYNGPVQIIIGIMNDPNQLCSRLLRAAEQYADAACGSI